jgi:hypothetical protein
MLAGYSDGTNWISGFFDTASFTETLADWGKTVVCGRFVHPTMFLTSKERDWEECLWE